MFKRPQTECSEGRERGLSCHLSLIQFTHYSLWAAPIGSCLSTPRALSSPTVKKSCWIPQVADQALYFEKRTCSSTALFRYSIPIESLAHGAKRSLSTIFDDHTFARSLIFANQSASYRMSSCIIQTCLLDEPSKDSFSTVKAFFWRQELLMGPR